MWSSPYRDNINSGVFNLINVISGVKASRPDRQRVIVAAQMDYFLKTSIRWCAASETLNNSTTFIRSSGVSLTLIPRITFCVYVVIF